MSMPVPPPSITTTTASQASGEIGGKTVIFNERPTDYTQAAKYVGAGIFALALIYAFTKWSNK